MITSPIDSKLKFNKRIRFVGIIFLFVFFSILESAPIKIIVTATNAVLIDKPERTGETLCDIPKNTVLDVEEKIGSYYKVTHRKESSPITGFINQMYVDEISTGEEISEKDPEIEKETGGYDAGIVGEIKEKLEDIRDIVIQNIDLDIAIEDLKSIIIKAHNIPDAKQRKELVAETCLWIGYAYLGKGEKDSALRVFRNMFEVDHTYAREITRNNPSQKINDLIKQAEDQYNKGQIPEYSIMISTIPPDAKIKIDGKEIGLSPQDYTTSVSRIQIEIEMKGYKSVNEEIFLPQAPRLKEFSLESMGRTVEIRSSPSGAKIYIDEVDTKQVTDSEIPLVPFGNHKLYLVKNNYASWEGFFDVSAGSESVEIEVPLIPNKYGFRRKWSGPTNEPFFQPTGIALDNQNNIYVVNISNISIKKFDATGRIVRGWGDAGREFRKVKNPAGIAVDSRGAVYVTDLKTNSVFIFSKTGAYVNKWNKSTSREKDFKKPRGIAVDRVGDIYVADSGNHRIMKFSTAGTLKKTWGKQGKGNGEFVNPVSIAFSQKNEVFVLDKSRVQKFASDGQFLGSFGRVGTGDGEFSSPKSLFLDVMNYVYVADSANHRIQKFDPDGVFVTKWGVQGRADGQLNYPVGIVIDRQGRIFVVERGNNRIQEFGIGGR